MLQLFTMLRRLKINMKVKELIQKLDKLNPDFEVVVQGNWNAFPLEFDDKVLNVFAACFDPIVIIDYGKDE